MRDEPNQPTNLIRLWGIFALILFGATWKLWTPQTGLPQIPFFSFLVGIPGWVDWILLTGLLLSTLGLIGNFRTCSIQHCSIAFVSFLLPLVMLNQHRLQPWAYLFLIMGILYSVAKPAVARTSLKWILVSIYFYSAISKFDYQFLYTTGDQMLQALAQLLNLSLEKWGPGARRSLVIVFPIFELLIGVLLIFSKTRSLGVYSAMGMHMTLIAVLGPLGLNHKPPVLIWNLFFLFLLPMSCRETNQNTKLEASARPFFAQMLLWFFLLFPMSQLAQIADHWVAWEVYAPRSSRVINLFPIQTPQGEQWESLAEWSLETLNVPIYPQGRFQFAVMQSLNEPDWRQPFELVSVSNRIDGSREKTTIRARYQAATIEKQFWLNCQPRTLWQAHRSP